MSAKSSRIYPSPVIEQSFHFCSQNVKINILSDCSLLRFAPYTSWESPIWTQCWFKVTEYSNRSVVLWLSERKGWQTFWPTIPAGKCWHGYTSCFTFYYIILSLSETNLLYSASLTDKVLHLDDLDRNRFKWIVAFPVPVSYLTHHF